MYFNANDNFWDWGRGIRKHIFMYKAERTSVTDIHGKFGWDSELVGGLTKSYSEADVGFTNSVGADHSRGRRQEGPHQKAEAAGQPVVSTES